MSLKEEPVSSLHGKSWLSSLREIIWMNPQILLQELQTIKQNLRVLIEKIINLDQWDYC